MSVTIRWNNGTHQTFPGQATIGFVGGMVRVESNHETIGGPFDAKDVVEAMQTNARGEIVRTVAFCICGREMGEVEGETRPWRYVPGGAEPGALTMRTICPTCLPEYDRTHPLDGP